MGGDAVMGGKGEIRDRLGPPALDGSEVMASLPAMTPSVDRITHRPYPAIQPYLETPNAEVEAQFYW